MRFALCGLYMLVGLAVGLPYAYLAGGSSVESVALVAVLAPFALLALARFCPLCGLQILPRRLKTLPDAERCAACQRECERLECGHLEPLLTADRVYGALLIGAKPHPTSHFA